MPLFFGVIDQATAETNDPETVPALFSQQAVANIYSLPD
jgi:hypothetical protein